MCFSKVFLLAWLARSRSSSVLEFLFSFSVSRGLSVVSSVPNVCLTSLGSSSVSVTFLSSSFSVVICLSCSSSSASCVFFMFFDLEVSFCFPEMCVSLFVSPVLIVLGSCFSPFSSVFSVSWCVCSTVCFITSLTSLIGSSVVCLLSTVSCITSLTILNGSSVLYVLSWLGLACVKFSYSILTSSSSSVSILDVFWCLSPSEF